MCTTGDSRCFPEILFLDEPTTGLDPATRKNVWQSIEQLRKEMNMTVFLTTHYMEEAAKATSIAIIDGGHIMERGTPFSLKEKYAKDRLVLFREALEAEKTVYKQKDGYITMNLENSMLAFPILQKMQSFLSGFELVQGSMDDVFLNVTGKTLVRVEREEKGGRR